MASAALNQGLQFDENERAIEMCVMLGREEYRYAMPANLACVHKAKRVGER